MALRRTRDGGDWVTLPAAGRAGPAPSWPMAEVSAREQALWEQLWASPQATEWEKVPGLELEVAIYVRRFAEAEQPKAAVTLGTLVRQQREDLGLSLTGMTRHKWKMGVAPEPAKSTRKRPSKKAPARRSARDRLTVVSGGD